MYRLPAVLVAGLLLLAGCSAPFTAAPAVTDAGVDAGRVADGATTNATTIAVSAAGRVTAAPDRAVVRFAVTATADTPDAARGAVATDVERVRTALRDAGIPDDAVRTSYFAVSPEYDYEPRNGTRDLVGYRAVHAFAVETDPGNAGRVVDLALGNGADEVHGVTFDLSDEARADLRSEALGRAVDAARSDADAVAGAAGLGVTGVDAIEVNDAGGPVPTYAARDESAGGATTFDPAPVTVTAQVRVTYTAA